MPTSQWWSVCCLLVSSLSFWITYHEGSNKFNDFLFDLDVHQIIPEPVVKHLWTLYLRKVAPRRMESLTMVRSRDPRDSHVVILPLEFTMTVPSPPDSGLFTRSMERSNQNWSLPICHGLARSEPLRFPTLPLISMCFWSDMDSTGVWSMRIRESQLTLIAPSAIRFGVLLLTRSGTTWNANLTFCCSFYMLFWKFESMSVKNLKFFLFFLFSTAVNF